MQRRFVRVLGVVGFFLAEEHDEEQPEHVKRGQHGDEHTPTANSTIILLCSKRLRENANPCE